MLDGFTPWPAEAAARWRAEGLWEGRTICEMLAATAARHPARIAVVDGERRVTYPELIALVERLAARLVRAGLGRQDRVVMQLPNSLAFVVTWLALTRIGAIPVMALRAHRETEVAHFVRNAGAVACMVPAVLQGFDHRAMARAVAAQCPTLRMTFVLGEPLEGQQALGPLIDEPLDAESISAALAGVHVDASDVTTMLLSGGTTSLSKLIPRTHDDYLLNAKACARVAGFDEHTVLLAVLPLGHNYNLASPGMLGVFGCGGCVVVSPAMDAATVFALVHKHRVTVIPAAVPLITAWLAAPVPEGCDLSSLKVIQNGGARLAPELRRRLRERFRCTPQEIYGTAEGLINMTRLDDPDELLLDTSGAPVCEADEIKVVDDAGHEVPDGEPGELLTRGPYTIRGYFNAPEKNREAFTSDGFYRMGDIVRKRGRYVSTEGRRNDLVNRGGEKISCEEVENLMFRHPAVHQAALVAMPDPLFGEKACAFVVCKPGSSLTLAELVAFLKAQRIASFKLPERLEVLDALPTSLVGKVLKRQLRETIGQAPGGSASAARR
ncbi:MAG: AMP-binding protein [Rubrivivax sp.]